MRRKIGLSGVQVCLAVVAFCAAAQAETRPFMTPGDPVAAPAGYTQMCERQPALCDGPALIQAQSLEGASVASTASLPTAASAMIDDVVTPALVAAAAALHPTPPSAGVPTAAAPCPPSRKAKPRSEAGRMALMTTVNRAVNRTIRSRTDLALYGVEEFWSLPEQVDGATYGDCEDFALEKRRRLIEAGFPAYSLSLAVVFTRQNQFHAVLVVTAETGDWVLDNLSPWPTPWDETGYIWIARQVAGGSNWTSLR